MVAPERWLRSWDEGRIGFHRDDVHPDLLAYADRFLGDGPQRVLVPLAGKTVDLAWLVAQGHQVTAVELSPVAAQAFHAEQGIQASVSTEGPHAVWRSPGLSYRVGDVFALEVPPEGPFTHVWDRAAMVALDPGRRARYVQHLRAVAPGARILLNVFEYDQALMDGPPHSVPDAEVRAAYPHAQVLHDKDLGGQPGIAASHPWWHQRTYLGTVSPT